MYEDDQNLDLLRNEVIDNSMKLMWHPCVSWWQGC